MALDVIEGKALPSIADLPVIPDTFPAMPRPRRNVCWALREMRDKFERGVVRWITRRARDGQGGYCLIGLAREVAYSEGGSSALYQATVYQMSRVVSKRLNVGPPCSDSDTMVMAWNDNMAYNVDSVCQLLKEAEELAERDGACEP